MEIRTDPTTYPEFEPPFIMIHPLQHNHRPIGYLPWPEQKKSKKKSKPKNRRKKK